MTVPHMKHLLNTRRRGALMFSILFITSLCLFPAPSLLIVAIEVWTEPAHFAWTGARPTWRAFAGMGVAFAVGIAFVWSIPCVFFAGLLLHGITAESPPLRLKPIVRQAMLAGIIVTSIPQVIVLLHGPRPGGGTSEVARVPGLVHRFQRLLRMGGLPLPQDPGAQGVALHRLS